MFQWSRGSFARARGAPKLPRAIRVALMVRDPDGAQGRPWVIDSRIMCVPETIGAGGLTSSARALGDYANNDA